MGYNSAKIKMKKNFIIISILIIAALTTSCHKEVVQCFSYDLKATFENAEGERCVTVATDKYQNRIGTDDAILMYVKVGNTSGEDIWMPLPLQTDSELYDFAFTDSGILVLTADAGEGYVWSTPTFVKYYKLIVMPKIVYTSNLEQGVDHSNYNEVVKAYNLYESAIKE